MCSVCQGYTGVACPVCGNGKRQEMQCPECGGLGHRGYFAFDIIKRVDVECTENAWMALADNEDIAESKNARYCRQELEPCTRCGGDGYILV